MCNHGARWLLLERSPPHRLEVSRGRSHLAGRHPAPPGKHVQRCDGIGVIGVGIDNRAFGLVHAGGRHTSRKVLCASVEFWKASNIFLSATTSLVFLSMARHTMP